MKKDNSTKTSNTVFATASIVTALSVAERGLGFLYRIVLSRLIGAEGLGIYQVSLSLFALFLTLGTGGIPITVSRLISKSKAENDINGEHGAVSAGITLSLLLTVPVLLIFLPFADKFTFLFSDNRCVSVFRILLIGLCFSSVYAVFRGSFWGNKNFLFPSIIEIAEETVMVIAGVLLLQRVDNALTGAKLAGVAVVISYLFSFTFSTVGYFACGGKLRSPKKALKPLFNATLPLTSVRASGSLVNSAVAVLLPAMLVRAGYTGADALELFGVVSGMAIPVLFIPATIIGSLSLVLVPELSEDYYKKNTKRLYKNLERGVSVSCLVACVLLPFFYALGSRLGSLAFSNLLAGEIISKGCVILLPMSLTMITTGMLNSMGCEKQTFLFYFVGASAMLLCILLLPAVCGVYTYVIGLGVSYVLTCICNFWLLHKKCDGFMRGYGKKIIATTMRGICAVLPLSLLGKLFTALFSKIFGSALTAIFSATAIALCTLLLYLAFGFLQKDKTRANFPFYKRKKANIR